MTDFPRFFSTIDGVLGAYLVTHTAIKVKFMVFGKIRGILLYFSLASAEIPIFSLNFDAIYPTFPNFTTRMSGQFQ